jgi:hypothetical protein
MLNDALGKECGRRADALILENGVGKCLWRTGGMVVDDLYDSQWVNLRRKLRWVMSIN